MVSAFSKCLPCRMPCAMPQLADAISTSLPFSTLASGELGGASRVIPGGRWLHVGACIRHRAIPERHEVVRMNCVVCDTPLILETSISEYHRYRKSGLWHMCWIGQEDKEPAMPCGGCKELICYDCQCSGGGCETCFKHRRCIQLGSFCTSSVRRS